MCIVVSVRKLRGIAGAEPTQMKGTWIMKGEFTCKHVHANLWQGSSSPPCPHRLLGHLLG